MDRRKGFKRLAIVLCVPWYVCWTLLGVGNWYSAQANHDAWMTASKAKGNLDMVEVYMAGDASSQWRVVYAVIATVIGPLLLWVLFLLGRWVYRGFKPSVRDAGSTGE